MYINETIEVEHNLRNYRFLGEEAEVLGTRLDAARKALAGAKSTWAKQYWQNAINQLVLQWKNLPVLHDADAQVSIIPRWTVDYNFYSTDNGQNGYSITDKMFDQVFRTDLQASWDRAREARLARAQF